MESICQAVSALSLSNVVLSTVQPLSVHVVNAESSFLIRSGGASSAESDWKAQA